MGTTGGGVWKTVDAGHHWHNVSDGYFKTGSVGAIAVSESDPNVIYVGMGEHAPRGVMTSHGDGIYKSDDGGKTWRHLGLAETQHIARIVIHPKNPDVVYVAAQGALHAPSMVLTLVFALICMSAGPNTARASRAERVSREP